MSHGLLFRNYLQSRGISDEAYYEVMRKVGLARNTAQSFLLPDTAEIRVPNICLLHTLFGVEPERFGLPPDIFSTRYSLKEAEVHCFNFGKGGISNYKPFIENFFNSINEHLLSVRERLYVCDYIAKIRGLALKEHNGFYRAKSTQYFENLEKIIPARNIQYWRIAQMPLDYERQLSEWKAVLEQYAPSHPIPSNPLEDAVAFLLEGMFPETIGHFYRCLRDFPGNCQFYVILQPFRLHTFYLADRTVSLTEYHRYDKSGIPVPDTLFINKCSSPSVNNPFDPGASDESVGTKYFESCLEDFTRHIEMPHNCNNRLSAALLVKCLYTLEDKLLQAIDNIHKLQRQDFAGFQMELTDTLRTVQMERLHHQHQLQSALMALDTRLKNVKDKIAYLSETPRLDTLSSQD